MEEYIGEIVSFSRANPIIAGVFGVVLLFLMIRKTKLFFGLLFLGLLLWGALSLIMNVATIGGDTKSRLIKKGGVDQNVR